MELQLENYLNLRIPPGEEYFELPLNPSILHLPVLRSIVDGNVSTEPLRQGVFEKIFKQVQQKAGFFQTATIHAIRRYLGKTIDGKSLFLDV